MDIRILLGFSLVCFLLRLQYSFSSYMYLRSPIANAGSVQVLNKMGDRLKTSESFWNIMDMSKTICRQTMWREKNGTDAYINVIMINDIVHGCNPGIIDMIKYMFQ